jgi:hypothetical protein
MIREAILRWARNREPDFIIGGRERPYLRRHWLIPRNPLLQRVRARVPALGR